MHGNQNYDLPEEEGDCWWWWWWWRGVFLPSRCGLSIFLKGVVMVRTQEPMVFDSTLVSYR
jgi:hypothetical protein